MHMVFPGRITLFLVLKLFLSAVLTHNLTTRAMEHRGGTASIPYSTNRLLAAAIG